MKKLVAVFLILSLLVSIYPLILAESEKPEVFTSGDWEYTVLSDGTVEIKGFTNQEATEVIIPGEIDGKKVTSIGERAFYYRQSLISIVIPSSVTSIGDSAFSACLSLTDITIPDSVTSIDGWAFAFDISLESVTIPDSVTDIVGNPFQCCEKLQAITVSTEHPALEIREGVLFSKADKRLVCYPCGLTDEIYEIPQETNIIADCAFMGCKSLKSVKIPESITTIGRNAFNDCSSLESVRIPDSVTSIEGRAFDDCPYLILTVSRDSYAEEYCKKCRVKYSYPVEQQMEENPKSIISGKWKYRILDDNTAELIWMRIPTVTSVDIPPEIDEKKVTHIGNGLFSNLQALATVTIPDSVTSIGESAFMSCKSLTDITMPDSVTSIGYGAFQYCKSLTSITLPKNLTSIPESAFSGCASLTDITIPDSVTIIGDWAFSDCTSLTSLTIPENVTSIGNWSFYNCSSLTLTVVRNSYAEQYCKENYLKYVYPD